MNRSQLEELRESIITKITPLLDGEGIPSEDRFNLLVRLAQTQGSYELYEKAYKLVAQIEDNDQKLNAYMRLLDDVETELDVQNLDNSVSDDVQEEVSELIPAKDSDTSENILEQTSDETVQN